MNNAELREFCTQMIGKFKLLSDIQKEMQYETIDAKFTEWELKKLIFALNVLREEVRKYVDTADTPQTENVVGNKATLTIKDGVVKVSPQPDCPWK